MRDTLFGNVIKVSSISESRKKVQFLLKIILRSLWRINGQTFLLPILIFIILRKSGDHQLNEEIVWQWWIQMSPEFRYNYDSGHYLSALLCYLCERLQLSNAIKTMLTNSHRVPSNCIAFSNEPSGRGKAEARETCLFNEN